MLSFFSDSGNVSAGVNLQLGESGQPCGRGKCHTKTVYFLCILTKVLIKNMRKIKHKVNCMKLYRKKSSLLVHTYKLIRILYKNPISIDRLLDQKSAFCFILYLPHIKAIKSLK